MPRKGAHLFIRLLPSLRLSAPAAAVWPHEALAAPAASQPPLRCLPRAAVRHHEPGQGGPVGGDADGDEVGGDDVGREHDPAPLPAWPAGRVEGVQVPRVARLRQPVEPRRHAVGGEGGGGEAAEDGEEVDGQEGSVVGEAVPAGVGEASHCAGGVIDDCRPQAFCGFEMYRSRAVVSF